MLKCSAFKGKHKIEDKWENTIYEVIEQPIGKMPVFKVKPIEGDGKMKVVHQNQLLPLFSNASDHTNKLNTESMVDQTVNMHGVIAVDAVTSHVSTRVVTTACSTVWYLPFLNHQKNYNLMDSIMSWI